LTVLFEAASGGEGAASASLMLSDQLGVALGTGASGAILAAGAALNWTDATSLSIAFALCAAFAFAAALASARVPRLLSAATRPSSSS
jgi:hypothetical protein